MSEAEEQAPVEDDARVKGTERSESDASPQVQHPALQQAELAYEVGDFVQVRALVTPLLKSEEATLREASAALLAKISIDPLQVVAMSCCAAVLFTIVYVWILS